LSSDIYEVYAVRYAHHDRRASENFLGGDPHDGPMVLRRYPPPKPGLDGIAVRLDVATKA
jgi:hypothetical protein